MITNRILPPSNSPNSSLTVIGIYMPLCWFGKMLSVNWRPCIDHDLDPTGFKLLEGLN